MWIQRNRYEEGNIRYLQKKKTHSTLLSCLLSPLLSSLLSSLLCSLLSCLLSPLFSPLLSCLLSPLSSPENDRPSSLVLEVIDYNMPLTTTYMKQMKLQCMGNNKVREVAACSNSTGSDSDSGPSVVWLSAPGPETATVSFREHHRVNVGTGGFCCTLRYCLWRVCRREPGGPVNMLVRRTTPTHRLAIKTL